MPVPDARLDNPKTNAHEQARPRSANAAHSAAVEQARPRCVEAARPRSANAAHTDPNPELAALFTHLRPLELRTRFLAFYEESLLRIEHDENDLKAERTQLYLKFAEHDAKTR